MERKRWAGRRPSRRLLAGATLLAELPVARMLHADKGYDSDALEAAGVDVTP